MTYATNLGNVLTQIGIAPVATVNADGQTTGVDLRGAVTANPSAATNYEGQIAFLLDSNNTAGSSPTLAIKIQESDDDSTYTDVTGGAFTGLTTGRSSQKVVLDVGRLKRYVRLDYDIGGTSSPAYSISVQAVVAKKNPA